MSMQLMMNTTQLLIVYQVFGLTGCACLLLSWAAAAAAVTPESGLLFRPTPHAFKPWKRDFIVDWRHSRARDQVRTHASQAHQHPKPCLWDTRAVGWTSLHLVLWHKHPCLLTDISSSSVVGETTPHHFQLP